MIERIMKGMAVKLATDAMAKAAENEHEDRILLVKHSGKKGQEVSGPPALRQQDHRGRCTRGRCTLHANDRPGNGLPQDRQRGI